MATSERKIVSVEVTGTSRGLDKIATEINKVSDAQDRLTETSEEAAKVTETTSRRQLSAATAYQRLVAQIDPVFAAQQRLSRGQGVLDSALKQGRITSDEYGAALAKLQARYATFGAANNNLAQTTHGLAGQTGNIAAQFQDVAVQLAGGQSPFLIALQQGTQLSSALGTGAGGTGGVVKALGGAFMSLLSPVSLATIGIIALGGAAVQYMLDAGEKTQTLDEKLKAHADVIASIKGAYGEAAKGVDEYVSKSSTVLEQQLRASTDRLKEELDKQSQAIISKSTTTRMQFTDDLGFGYGDEIVEANKKYEAFTGAIARLREELKQGHPDIKAFQEAIALAVEAAGDDKDLRKFGDELIARSEDALKVEEALIKAGRAIDVLNGAAVDGAGDLKTYGDALKALSQIGLPNLTDQQRALQEYRRAVGSLGDTDVDGRNRARTAYNDAVGRANQRDAEKAAEDARKASERDAEAAQRKAESEQRRLDNVWKSAVDRVQDQTRALDEQATTYGQGAGEIARYRAEQELLNAAWEAGKADTPELRAQIDALANQAGEAADRIEHLKQASAFEDMGRDALKGFISDLRSGTSAADAFAKALDKILDRLLDMTLDFVLGKGPNPFEGILSMLKGGTGAGSAAQGAAAGTAFQGLGKLPEVVKSAVEPLATAAKSAASATQDVIADVLKAGSSTGVTDLSRMASFQGAPLKDVQALIMHHTGGGGTPEGVVNTLNQRGLGAQYVMDRNGNLFQTLPDGMSGAHMLPGSGAGAGLSNSNTIGVEMIAKNNADLTAAQVESARNFYKQLQEKYGEDLKVFGHGEVNPGHKLPSEGMGAVDAIRNGPQALNSASGTDSLVGGTKQLSQGFDDLSQTTKQLTPDMQQLGQGVQQIGQNLGTQAPEIGKNLTSLGQTTSNGGAAVGNALTDTAGTIAQGANGVGNALQQLLNSMQSGGGGGGGLLSFFTGAGIKYGSDGVLPLGPALANGGVMTEFGLAPLNKYSNGGIANRPQMALFGEGRNPEAYVPLPDGRTIPVTMQGGGGGGVVVNAQVINNTSAQIEQKQVPNSSGGVDLITVVSEKTRADMVRERKRNGGFAKQIGAGFDGRG
jgi:hypothetical protein